MTIHEAGELISLGWTIPTLMFCLAVMLMWGKEVKSVFKKPNKNYTPHHWFIIGVFIGFSGEFFDNVYWGVAWCSEYLKLPGARTWFKNGVYVNIPFRQIMGTVAAYCHVRSALAYGVQYRGLNNLEDLKRYLHTSITLGILFVLGLIYLKHYL